jgi:hypothetical protein
MFKRMTAVLLIGLAVFMWGCPKDDDEDKQTTPETTDVASGTARSSDTTTTVIQTPAGVTLTIPPGAVPPFDDGATCTQTFSIERTNDSPVTPPSGETVATDVYRFGPESFVFAAPVEVSIPVANVPANYDVLLYRTNPITGAIEQMPAAYNPTTGKITTSTYEFCCWFGTTRPHVNTASGCIFVDNTTLNYWVRVCVESYELTYPDQDEDNMASYGDGGVWAPVGTIGWASSGKYFIPQGVFNLCIQWSRRDWLSGETTYYHRMQTGVTVNSAWNYWDSPNCSYTLTVGDPVGADTGECVCVPVPSNPVHTGDIQVTLNWYNTNPLDLDLWVWDPAGDSCFYGHGQYDTTATGAHLDRDNLCWNYENGRPENIYWTRTPPTGEYRVAVDWFSSCGYEHPNQNFGVRVVYGSTTRTYSGVIAPNTNLQEVCRFTFSGQAVTFLPPDNTADYSHIVKPAKVRN